MGEARGTGHELVEYIFLNITILFHQRDEKNIYISVVLLLFTLYVLHIVCIVVF